MEISTFSLTAFARFVCSLCFVQIADTTKVGQIYRFYVRNDFDFIEWDLFV